MQVSFQHKSRPCFRHEREQGQFRVAEEGVAGHIVTVLKVSFIQALFFTTSKPPASCQLLRWFVSHAVNKLELKCE